MSWSGYKYLTKLGLVYKTKFRDSNLLCQKTNLKWNRVSTSRVARQGALAYFIHSDLLASILLVCSSALYLILTWTSVLILVKHLFSTAEPPTSNIDQNYRHIVHASLVMYDVGAESFDQHASGQRHVPGWRLQGPTSGLLLMSANIA